MVPCINYKQTKNISNGWDFLVSRSAAVIGSPMPLSIIQSRNRESDKGFRRKS